MVKLDVGVEELTRRTCRQSGYARAFHEKRTPVYYRRFLVAEKAAE